MKFSGDAFPISDHQGPISAFHSQISNFTVNPANRLQTGTAEPSSLTEPHSLSVEQMRKLPGEKGVSKRFLEDESCSNGVILQSPSTRKNFPFSLFPWQNYQMLKLKKNINAFPTWGWEKWQYHTDTENKACLIQFTVADHSSLLLNQA